MMAGAATSQRTAAVPAKAPDAAKLSLSEMLPVDEHVWHLLSNERNLCFIAEQPAPATHLAYPEGCAALRIVLVTVPRASRSSEHIPDEFDLHLLRPDER